MHQRCLAGAEERGEGEYLGTDGRIDWLRWEVLPWNDDAGNIGGLMILTEVLNERKRAEATLQASEEQHRELIESLNDAIFATDAGGIFTYMSPVIRIISQYAPEDVVGRSFREFVHPDDLSAATASFERTLHGNREPAEYRVVDRDGSIRWVRSFSRVVRDGERIVGLRGVLSDITPAKEAEQAHRALVDHALQGLAIVQDGQIAFANRAFEDFTGAPLAQQVGLSLLEWIETYVHPDDRAGILAGLASWQPGRGEVRRREFRVMPCAGVERWLATLTSELTYRGREAVQVLFADVTERRRVEDELRRLNAELEQRVRDRTAALAATAEQLEAFGYSVSHDLRAPLRAIDGFSRAVLEDYGALLPEAGVGYLQRVRAGAQRMGELIDHLLTLSGALRGELRRERLDLGVLAREVVAELSAAEPDRVVAFRAAEGLVVHGDAVLLRAALANLLGNAWKFTRRCARASVELGRCESEPPTFYVRDNGIGFAMPDPAMLFRPFQRLHSAEEFEGHGIGLATVQRIVQRHGGRVWAESVPGQGATFYFTLGG
jgi:PAS domain S-box-containing protein